MMKTNREMQSQPEMWEMIHRDASGGFSLTVVTVQHMDTLLSASSWVVVVGVQLRELSAGKCVVSYRVSLMLP